jgi:hypothetical protein
MVEVKIMTGAHAGGVKKSILILTMLLFAVALFGIMFSSCKQCSKKGDGDGDGDDGATSKATSNSKSTPSGSDVDSTPSGSDVESNLSDEGLMLDSSDDNGGVAVVRAKSLTPEQIALRDAVKNVRAAILNVTNKANDRRQAEDTAVKTPQCWFRDKFADLSYGQISIIDDVQKATLNWVGLVEVLTNMVNDLVNLANDMRHRNSLPIGIPAKSAHIDNILQNTVTPAWDLVLQAWGYPQGRSGVSADSWKLNRIEAIHNIEDGRVPEKERYHITMEEAENEFNRASDGLIRAKNELVKAINDWIDANR